MSNMIHDDYSERLLDYITDYVRKEGVPPTVDMMIQNVPGKSSKSTVYNRLQKMVDDGLLIQKNIKGYYYPTSICLLYTSPSPRDRTRSRMPSSA